uniref:Uncharacterized protein n=1 Tax=Oncorhynchus kisutch TaxID=8019 RepID=A0A8C7L0F9_ONCKI
TIIFGATFSSLNSGRYALGMATAPSNNSLGLLLRQNLTARMTIMKFGIVLIIRDIFQFWHLSQVAEREGCPLSFTDTMRFCFMLSDSEMSRCVLISPLWRPIVKSPGSVDLTI